MKLSSIQRLALVTSLSLGCAAGPPARVVRVTDLDGAAGPLQPGQPLVLEFHEGDSLPVDFVLAGPLMESAKDAQPIMLTAKRRFFLRIDEDGVSTSLDGSDFSKRNKAPGSFQIGLSVTKERGVRGNVTVKGPTPREPE